MAGLIGLAHIGIYTADMDKTLDFYCDKLGFEQFYSRDLGTTQLRFVRAGGCILEFIKPEQYDGSKPADGVIAHIAIEVEDIRAVVAGLKAKGVAFRTEDVAVLPLFPSGSTNIFLTGPNGEALELYEYKA